MKKISTVFLMLISSGALYLSQPTIASPLNQTSMQTTYSSTDPEKKTKSDNKSKKGDDSNLSGNGNGYGHCKHHENGVGNNGNNDGLGHDKYDGDCVSDDDGDTASISLKTVEADPEELDPQELGVIWVTITGNKSKWDSTLLTINGSSYCYAHSYYSSKTLGFQYYAPSSTGTYQVDISVFGEFSNGSANSNCSGTGEDGSVDIVVVGQPDPVVVQTATTVTETIYESETFTARIGVTGEPTTWDSTRITINGVSTCYPHSSNSDSEQDFSVTAPSDSGTYTVTVEVFSADSTYDPNDGCNGTPSTTTFDITVEEEPSSEHICSAVWPTAINMNHSKGVAWQQTPTSSSPDYTLSFNNVYSADATTYVFDELVIENSNLAFNGTNDPVIIYANSVVINQSNVNEYQTNPMLIITRNLSMSGAQLYAAVYVEDSATVQGSKIFGSITSQEDLGITYDNTDENDNNLYYRPSSFEHTDISAECLSISNLVYYVLDEFNSVSYTNNDGEADWVHEWRETNDDGSPYYGDIYIYNGELHLTDGNHYIRREVNLSGFTEAILEFEYTMETSYYDDEVYIQIRTSNGSWHTLKTLEGGYDYSGKESIDISAYIAEDVDIRIITAYSFESNDHVSFNFIGILVDGDSTGDPEHYYFDKFNSVSYGNNDGLEDWDSGWVEYNDDGSPSTGYIKITNNQLKLSNADRRITRTADLTTMADATVSFSYLQDVDYFDDDVYLEINTGDGWELLHKFDTNGEDMSGNFELDISQYVGNVIDIRFRTEAPFDRYQGFNYDNYFWVENFAIDCNVCNVSSSTEHYRIIHPANTLTCLAPQIEVKACSEDDCSALSTDSISGSLYGGTTKLMDLATNTGSQSVSYNFTSAGTVALSLTNLSPSASVQCYLTDGTASNCNITVAESGYILTLPEQFTSSKTDVQQATIQAVKASDHSQTCVPDYTGAQTINVDFNYVTPDSQQVNVQQAIMLSADGSSFTPVNYGSGGMSMNLSFDTDTAAAQFYFKYQEAGKISLTVSDPSGVIISDSKETLAVPSQLYYSFVNPEDSEWLPASYTAGTPFTFTVQAITNDISPDVTQNYVSGDLQMDVTLPNLTGGASRFFYGSNLSTPSTADDGWQSVTGSFTNGVMSYDSAYIDDLGTINFDVRDIDYFGQSIPSQGQNLVSRFTPQYYQWTNTVTGEISGGNDVFAYIGQQLSYSVAPEFEITAYNSLNQVAGNFGGGVGSETLSLVNNNMANRTYTEQAVGTGFNGGSLATSNYLNFAQLDDFNGSITMQLSSDQFEYIKSATPTEPFNTSINLNFTMTDLVDNDGVGYCPVGSEPCLSGYSALSVPLSSVLELRYGRISVENGYGPEDIDYKLPLYVQTYLNGAFIQNADDNESNFNMLLGTAQDVTTAESYNLYVTSNNGSVFITGETQGADGIYLEVKNVVTEVYMEFINVPSYLNIDWNEDGAIDGNDKASANVILGTYRGNDRIIYKRER